MLLEFLYSDWVIHCCRCSLSHIRLCGFCCLRLQLSPPERASYTYHQCPYFPLTSPPAVCCTSCHYASRCICSRQTFINCHREQSRLEDLIVTSAVIKVNRRWILLKSLAFGDKACHVKCHSFIWLRRSLNTSGSTRTNSHRRWLDACNDRLQTIA